MRIPVIVCLFLFSIPSFGQVWVDSSYAVQVTNYVFLDNGQIAASGWDDRFGDIYLPIGDTPPICGRPAVLILHGGFFQFGTKQDALPRKMALDFASRGYCAISIDYRSGLNKPNDYRPCPGVDEWACLQATDSAEWYRAVLKAGQDIHATLRILYKNNSNWNLSIDFRNIFLIGEDAGAMACLSAGYRNEWDEMKHPAYSQYTEVDWPSPSYEYRCLIGNVSPPNHFDIRRLPIHTPYRDLPAWPPTQYRIKAIGSLNGGVFDDVFTDSDSTYQPFPAIYFYHQPDNRLVPFHSQPILDGYVQCASSLISCPSILNRPILHGPSWILGLLDSLNNLGLPIPQTLLDTVSGNYPCSSFSFDPLLHNHSVYNRDLLSHNLSVFFRQFIDSTSACLIGIDEPVSDQLDWVIFPNPVKKSFSIQGLDSPAKVEWFDAWGRIIAVWEGVDSHSRIEVPAGIPSAVYWVRVSDDSGRVLGSKVVVED